MQVQQSTQMRLPFGEEPGTAGQPAVSLPPLEILIPFSGYPPDVGDGVQVQLTSPPRIAAVHTSGVNIDIR
ncbi:MAG TPA: hypothetical protein VFI90_00100 [Rubrobacter sp.]|nr:hypothetical protein [Rubrobacter sp.]